MRRLFFPAIAALLAACAPPPQPAEVAFHPLGDMQGRQYTVYSYASKDSYWSSGFTSYYYAYTPCEGVSDVCSDETTPLHLKYTTNDDLSCQNDLLVAVASLEGEGDSVDLDFKHALSCVSVVWDPREDDKPEETYKLRRLTIWAKQAGYMTLHPGSTEPKWELEHEGIDHRFVVYECSDYYAPDEQREYANPDADSLRVAGSLLLVPGLALGADVEYSYWLNGEYVDTRVASNLILGGRENSASDILYNTHYTYTFVPDADGIQGVRVRLDAHEWDR